MKKIYLAMIIVAVTLIGCSKEEINPSSTTGMTLTTNVSEPTTKSTINDGWKFSFEQGDVVKVTNSTLSSGTYYTFTKEATNFTSTDAQTTSTVATWYAFFPGTSIDLTNQGGTMDNAADRFGYAGKQNDVAASSKTLNITMFPQMSIIKVVNNKGSISLNAQTSAGNYITGMTASTDGPTFTVTTSTTASNLLSKTETGTYYIAVPSQTAFDIYDGTTKLKSIAADKLVVGNYYTLTISAPEPPTGALNGVFSVSSTSKVYFSKGNLQYQAGNGTTADPKWRFAVNQYDYIGNAAGNNVSSGRDTQSDWIDLFGWGTTGYQDSRSYTYQTNIQPYSTSSIAATTDPKKTKNKYGYGPDYSSTSQYGLKVDKHSDWGYCMGGESSIWYTLSMDEWTYLMKTRTDAASKFGYATVAGVSGIIILPDTFTDPMKNGGSGVFVPQPNEKASRAYTNNIYTSGDNWNAMESAGAVFLPVTGYRADFEFTDVSTGGYYWESTVRDGVDAYCMTFNSSAIGTNSYMRRFRGMSVRLVTAAQ